MADILMTRLYELMVVLYAVSLVLYFIDYFNKRPQLRRIAFWLVSIVWTIQTSYLILYMIEMKRFPVLALAEGILFYAWLLVTLSIVLHCIAKVDLPVLVIYSLGFIFVTIYTFMPKRASGMVSDSLVSEMLLIHIFFAIIAYAVFTLAFVFSILYLVLYRMLKKKKITHTWSRIPSLQQMSNWMSVTNYIGIPILLVSLVLGLEWAILRLESLSLYDPKIVGSFLLIVLYCGIIYANRRGKLTGTRYAWTQIYAYLLVVINFFLGSSLSNFHLWY